MSVSQFQIEEVSNAYWRVRFENPPVNLVNAQTVLQFQAVVDRIEASQTLRVVVFESANPDYFFGRYDLARVADTPVSNGPSGLPTWIDMTVRLSQAPAVSIALIRGRTRGGGAELALAMDMRFASIEGAILGQPEVGAGVLPGGGAIERLPLLTGRARALEIMLGSDDFDALTAERYGWINRALPDAQLDGFVHGLAQRIASFDREAIAETKRLVNRRALPDPRDLVETQDVFLNTMVHWPSTGERQVRIGKKVAQVGPAEFERNMGHHLANL
ncbi:enoyl-CoA hydratase/isomerase family protein [Pseudomonas batumici]|uniref:Enoyl-CoA hydratase n=1 Tax=Pseudomonas batumici TaxID=226910 RepID=A0A0C2EC20_9PSED|nr:enoyl-CoA hydratase/isomerase family protein [Pseudomonas batumici]KIH83434.1 Enoyl-CoA hydratase [Pseudomonas batumici]